MEMKKKKIQNFKCPTTGYEVYREPIGYFEDISKIGFLGSGYPCFYNFIIYCAFMLFLNMCTNSGFNLITNYLGDFCRNKDVENEPIGIDGHAREEMYEKEEKRCHDTWTHIFSLANKINRPEFLYYQGFLSLTMLLLQMCVMVNFRASQRQIDVECDVSNVTPADYTIMIRNLPILKGCDYKK